MVLQKRLDYGFNGYQVPDMPRASRSARGKRSFRKQVEGNQMCAFDLLATVAGKLLLEKESCSNPTIKKENQDEEKPFKQELCDQGSCDEGTFASKISPQKYGKNCSSKGYNHVHDDLNMGTASTGVENSPCAEESIISRSKKDFENFSVTVRGKCLAERGSPGSAESHDGKLEEEIGRQLETEQKMIGTVVNGPRPNVFSSVDQMELDTKPPALVSSDSSVEVPMYGNHIPCGSFARLQGDEKIVSKDDDENSSGCTQPSTIMSKVFSSTHVGDRRIRKLLASKHWKVAPTSLRDGELSKNDSDVKPVSGSRKTCYTRQRTQRCNPFKRRRLFEQSSITTSDGGISSEGVSNSHEKKTINDEATGSACRVASPVADQKSSTEDRDLHVKLNIKSFRVPELVIEIPETATIDSLKRTVMEAVTTVLGGGLRVGVLLQGKKIRDDNKTLLQSGISHDNKLDGLGFILEPSYTHSPSLQFRQSSHNLLPCDPTQLLTRCPQVPASDPGTACDVFPAPPPNNSCNCIESDHDSVPSPTDMSLEKNTTNSKALVPIQAVNMEALAMVPLPRKSRRSEFVQRRIRRPFSVSEVEALVQAVEKLGTGRWRDVKLRAFENAKHRTYVDLKDKWKTLVHTARISPQQRRGEPVPQELLDRVLSAHAYWSQQQAKQLLKQQQSEACLLL